MGRLEAKLDEANTATLCLAKAINDLIAGSRGSGHRSGCRTGGRGGRKKGKRDRMQIDGDPTTDSGEEPDDESEDEQTLLTKALPTHRSAALLDRQV